MSDRILITGATGGLGQALVQSFTDGHNKLALHYRTDEGMAALLVKQVQQAGAQACALPLDLAAPNIDEAIRYFVAQVHNEIGTPNIAVLNAADQQVTPWEELTATSWDEIYQTNFRSVAVLLHELARGMEQITAQNRVIVLIGSVEGIRPAAGHAPYATMKAALHHLVLAAAHELGPRGMRVVGVAPGLIDRPNLAADWPTGVNRWNEVAALGRAVTATEVAAAVKFLASPTASGITGVTLPVDAGWSAHPGW